MNALRLPAAAVAAAVLTVAVVLGASCSGPVLPDCGIPSPWETAADGGPDPCHCDPPPSLNWQACLCLSGTKEDVDVYNACMVTYRAEIDAGGQ
jgi:hypothetical protein